MATTANYGWTKPTVLGDVGAWGTIANTLFDAVDAQVKAIDIVAAGADAKAVVAQVDIVEIATITYHASEGTEIRGANPSTFQPGPSTAVIPAGNPSSREIWYVLDGLCPGLRITSIYSRAQKATGINCILDVKLLYADGAGTSTLVSAGHSHTTSLATLTTAGINHDVVAGRRYYIVVFVQTDTGPATWYHVGLTVSRP